MQCLLFGIINGQNISVIGDFFDCVSIDYHWRFFCCVMIMSPSLKGFLNYLKSFTLILKVQLTNEEETIKQIISLSNIARKEGLLALEEAANGIDDNFLKKGVLLIVDGTDPELVRSILETELSCIGTGIPV